MRDLALTIALGVLGVCIIVVDVAVALREVSRG